MTTRRRLGAAAALVSLLLAAWPVGVWAEEPVRAAERCVEVRRDDGTSYSCEVELRRGDPRVLCLNDGGPYRFCGLQPTASTTES